MFWDNSKKNNEPRKDDFETRHNHGQAQWRIHNGKKWSAWKDAASTTDAVKAAQRAMGK